MILYIVYIYYLRFKRYAFIWFHLMSQVCGGLRWQVCWQVRWRWQLAMAMRVAVSELVASLMAESDGKNRGNHVLVAKGVATIHGKN